jgi:hypothetical protein
MILLHEVALMNPFDTEHFFWIDAGYFRGKGRDGYRPIVRNNITAHGVAPDQIVFQRAQDDESHEIAGGAFGGTSRALARAYDLYWLTFWHMIQQKKDCVGFEQRVMVWMCMSFPDLCHIHTSTNWFAMGKTWLPNADYDFAATRRGDIPLDAKERPVVEEGSIQFPKEKILTRRG